MINNKLQHIINLVIGFLTIMALFGVCGSYELGSIRTGKFFMYSAFVVNTATVLWIGLTLGNKKITEKLLKL